MSPLCGLFFPPSASFLTPCVAQSLSHFSSLVQPFHLKSGGAKSVQKLRHQKVVSKFVLQKYFCENVG